MSEKELVLEPIRRRLTIALERFFHKQKNMFMSKFDSLRYEFPNLTESIRLQESGIIDWPAFWDFVSLMTVGLVSGEIDNAVRLSMLKAGLAEIGTMNIATSFTLANPKAVEYLNQYGSRLIAGVNNTTKDMINTVISKSMKEGWGYGKTSKEIRSMFDGFSERKPQAHIANRAEGIAVTECFPSDTLVIPFPFSIFPLSQFSKLPFVITHWLGSKPESPIKGATRRWYEGDMIEITTSTGNKLSGTPNHPILTERGWIDLNSLIKGDNIICSSGREKMGFSNPDINYIPTQISEIFDSIQGSPSATIKRTRGGNMDFHGDGKLGEVEIVFINRELKIKDQSTIFEPSLHKNLSVTNLRSRSIAGFGSFREAGGGFFDSFSESCKFAHSSSGSGMSISKSNETLFGGSLRPHHNSRFGHISNVDIVVDKNGFDIPIRTTNRFSYGFTGLPAGISIDNIVNIKRFNFTGRVYNLSTNSKSYIANGIVTHNCGNAYEEANLIQSQGLQMAGLPMEKAWLVTGGDICDICQDNADAGWIPLDDAFPSGDMRPLAHPYCRCSMETRWAREGRTE